MLRAALACFIKAHIFCQLRALPVAELGNGKKLLAWLCDASANNFVAVTERNTLHARRITAHDAHIRFVKADCHAVSGGKEDVIFTVRLHDGDKFVAIVECQRADTGFSRGIEAREKNPLDGALLRDEHEIIVVKFVDGDTGSHGLAGLEGQDIHNIRALGGSACFGNLIALLTVDLAEAREEEDIIVRGCGEDALGEVLFLEGLAGHAAAAALLGAIGRGRDALDIARVGEGKDALFLFDEVFDINFVLDVLNFGAALVAVFVADGDELVF